MSLRIPDRVRLAAAAQLGSAVMSVDWTSGRVGVVWAVRLEDGRRCVVKSRPATPGLLQRLEVVARVQHELSAAGVPVPDPIASPLQDQSRILTFEPLMTTAAEEVSHDDARSASLSMLLRLVEVGETLADDLRPLRSVSSWVDSDVEARHGSTWPTPHDPSLFGPSFEGASARIEALATAASVVLAEWWRRPERVLGHDDWEAQNLVFSRLDGRAAVVTIFDTESLSLLPEPVLAGCSGLQHGRGLPQAPDAPTTNEVGAWIDDFATRRGGRPASWLRAAWAAAAWSLAYNARCDELTGTAGPGSHLEACRRDGSQYRANFVN